jgi:hypothetical protein
MLTRSPKPTPRSASASPNFPGGVRYAPAPSPRQSPSWINDSLPRRQQGQATSSSPRAAQKPYVGVDAATQYSPMASRNATTDRGVMAPQTPQRAPSPPPPPHPKPLDLREQPSKGEDNAATETGPPASATRPSNTVADTAHNQSPSANKRRNSQGPGGSVETVAGPSTDPLASAKRPRPEDAASKVLPRRYELCPVDDLVVLIANMLGELIETNDALGLKSGHLTRFHSRYVDRCKFRWRSEKV